MKGKEVMIAGTPVFLKTGQVMRKPGMFFVCQGESCVSTTRERFKVVDIRDHDRVRLAALDRGGKEFEIASC